MKRFRIADCFELRRFGFLAVVFEFHNPQSEMRNSSRGEVQEWLNWQHWKCCERGTVPWVRIPPSPPQECRIANCELRIADLEFGI